MGDNRTYDDVAGGTSGYDDEVFVFRTSGSAVRAVLDPEHPDDPDWEHEPERDDLTSACPYYWPGHHVHWIQAKLGLRTPAVPVRVLEVAGLDVQVVLEDTGVEEVWRLHDPSLLALELIARPRLVVGLHEHNLVSLGGRLWYPCRDLAQWRPCPPPEGEGTA
ncbi:MAG: hypothetical protein R2737_00195 [Candidatus Nanopelagicales bacterium]